MNAFHILKIEYKPELITWYDGNRYFMSDFSLPNLHGVCELDGKWHLARRQRDREKDAMIKSIRRVWVLREWNSWWTTPNLVERLNARLIEFDRLRRLGL
jgi:very-short-patch-repair endonuclease